jgi:hypothetical protein
MSWVDDLTKKLEKDAWREYRQEKARMLEAATAYLRLDKDMRTLLDRAEKEGVTIKMSDKLLGRRTNGQFSRSESSDQKTIILKPCRTMLETAKTLAHELSHYYQTCDLGVDNQRLRALESPDIYTAIIVMRVKEADATARAKAVMRRLKNQPDTIEMMQQDFIEHLDKLEKYDLRRVRGYHERHTRPGVRLSKVFNKKSLKENERTVNLSDLRGLLRTSIAPDAPNYMEGISDRKFESLLLDPIRPDVREAMARIDKVEKDIVAGKSRTLPVRQARYKLHEKVTAL